jgi:hypothetical protein
MDVWITIFRIEDSRGTKSEPLVNSYKFAQRQIREDSNRNFLSSIYSRNIIFLSDTSDSSNTDIKRKVALGTYLPR